MSNIINKIKALINGNKEQLILGTRYNFELQEPEISCGGYFENEYFTLEKLDIALLCFLPSGRTFLDKKQKAEYEKKFQVLTIMKKQLLIDIPDIPNLQTPPKKTDHE